MKKFLFALFLTMNIGCAMADQQQVVVLKPKPKAVHLVSRTGKYAVTTSALKAVTDAAKVTTFPLRHPVKVFKTIF